MALIERVIKPVIPKRTEHMNWNVEYDNNTGPGDEGFWEWWTVTDGERSFKCDSKEDAEWLRKLLNQHASSQAPTVRGNLESTR